jgi:hypothetical protein
MLSAACRATTIAAAITLSVLNFGAYPMATL